MKYRKACNIKAELIILHNLIEQMDNSFSNYELIKECKASIKRLRRKIWREEI